MQKTHENRVFLRSGGRRAAIAAARADNGTLVPTVPYDRLVLERELG